MKALQSITTLLGGMGVKLAAVAIALAGFFVIADSVHAIGLEAETFYKENLPYQVRVYSTETGNEFDITIESTNYRDKGAKWQFKEFKMKKGSLTLDYNKLKSFEKDIIANKLTHHVAHSSQFKINDDPDSFVDVSGGAAVGYLSIVPNYNGVSLTDYHLTFAIKGGNDITRVDSVSDETTRKLAAATATTSPYKVGAEDDGTRLLLRDRGNTITIDAWDAGLLTSDYVKTDLTTNFLQSIGAGGKVLSIACEETSGTTKTYTCVEKVEDCGGGKQLPTKCADTGKTCVANQGCVATTSLTAPSSTTTPGSQVNIQGNVKDVTQKDISITNPLKFDSVEQLIVNIINYVLGLAGLVAIGMIIFSGYQYISSAGDPKKTEGAKSTLRNAIIGLVIIILSFIIVRTVRDVVTGEYKPQNLSTSQTQQTSTTSKTSPTPSPTGTSTAKPKSGECHDKCNEADSGKCGAQTCASVLNGQCSYVSKIDQCLSEDEYCNYNCAVTAEQQGGSDVCISETQCTDPRCTWKTNKCVGK